ncbi:hypothetical protein [Conexibacter woesei]|uniref:Carboxypeptidase regulatory-like domain-containing protein n=1 Tax=Conexibacter woesei (strain DSM 14684 / CCUG 47730 / CIP 108061 / JCM 11494 / NBRC 100937 / ID131577) TaxID=469383 RepID=D3FDZ6_CONWI|nr:hypothetical protein [Conexibacter woesei]ADB51612.1 hypothetical protein Cwoe_3193 [Conexibacter woesei DSM 14684]
MRWRIAVAALVAFVACMGATAIAAPAVRTPSLVVRPRAAAPGGTVVFFGRDFPPHVRLVLLAGPPSSEATPIGAAHTDREGRFRAPIKIARGVTPGRYVALACRHDCRVKASAMFRVLAPRE